MGRLDLGKNYLIFGDNLDVLREYIQDESICGNKELTINHF